MKEGRRERERSGGKEKGNMEGREREESKGNRKKG